MNGLTKDQMEALVVQFAGENRRWGYRRIVGALKNRGYEVSHQTVANVLRRHDIAPAPERRRRMSWRGFIRSHSEMWTAGGLSTYYVLTCMRLDTRN